MPRSSGSDWCRHHLLAKVLGIIRGNHLKISKEKKEKKNNSLFTHKDATVCVPVSSVIFKRGGEERRGGKRRGEERRCHETMAHAA